MKFCVTCDMLEPNHSPDCHNIAGSDEIITKFENVGINYFTTYTHSDNIKIFNKQGILSPNYAKHKLGEELHEYRDEIVVDNMRFNFKYKRISKLNDFEDFISVYFRRPNFYYSKRHGSKPVEIRLSLNLLRSPKIRDKIILLSQNLFSGKETREDIYFWRHLNPANINWDKLKTEGFKNSYDKFDHGRKTAASLLIKDRIPPKYILAK